VSRKARIVVGSLAALASVLYAGLGYARYATYHNTTFDLAFYARMAWGYTNWDYWEPIVNAHFYGLHLSPILFPLGLVGAIAGEVETLLVAQGVALAWAAWPLARMAERRFGFWGAVAGAGAWLLFPNLAHVAGDEFHPGTIATLPLAWMMVAFDEEKRWLLLGSVVGVLLCREDLALITALGSIVAMRHRALRPIAIASLVVSLAWVSFFLFVLHPAHAPAVGSMDLHFGKWGHSVPEALGAMISRPGELAEHLWVERRIEYLPRVLWPLVFLPLVRPKWLLLASPVLAVNLLSDWPTSTDLESHYLTPAVPALVAGAIDGLDKLVGGRAAAFPLAAFAASAVAFHVVAGGSPASLDFDRAAYVPDARSAAAAAIVARIPDGASVQVPYALMPHLAARKKLGPPPPPERPADYTVFDAWHRDRYRHRETLLRTTEEPPLRAWLARGDHALVAAEGTYLLFERGRSPRDGAGMQARIGEADPASGERLSACLRFLGAELERDRLVLELVATGACPSDLAVRIGRGRRPRRVDLLFEGLLSPAHLVRGDRLRSIHAVRPHEYEAWSRDGVRVGLLRSSGARPEHDDPMSIQAVTRE
jgi:uncharacterized membrane protein